jgi:hypothetical protein
MAMKRHWQWPRRLHQLVESSQAVTFTWGTYDCGQFAARWIREATGVDVAAAYRGKYKDEAGAEALFLNGHPDLGSFAAEIAFANGMVEITPITYARRGDVVWVDNSTALNPSKYGALGVVSLDGRYAVCMSSTGTKRVHMQRWRRAWRVG